MRKYVIYDNRRNNIHKKGLIIINSLIIITFFEEEYIPIYSDAHTIVKHVFEINYNCYNKFWFVFRCLMKNILLLYITIYFIVIIFV